jgi:hypothetical protein
MTIPVWVEQQNGRFSASVLGSPQLRATGGTKDEAVAALIAELNEKQRSGELVLVNLPTPVPMAPRRQLSEEEIEETREMVAEIYRERDEQKRREFPE